MSLTSMIRCGKSTISLKRNSALLLLGAMALSFYGSVPVQAQVIIQGIWHSNTGDQLLNPSDNANYASSITPLINPCTSNTVDYRGSDCAWPIDSAEWPEPSLEFYVEAPYNTSAYTIIWQLAANYKDRANINNPQSQSATLSGSQPWTPNWNNREFGGSVAIRAQVKSSNSCSGLIGNLTFAIWGVNQDAGAQLRYAAQQTNSLQLGGAAWFLPNLIAVESGGLQFGYYSGGFHSSKQPLWGPPDGIGVMQVDRTVQGNAQYFTTENPYWNFMTNLQDGVDVLANLQQNSAPPSCDTNYKQVTNRYCKGYAYDFWDRQIYQACIKNGGSATPMQTNGPGTEYCNVNIPAAPGTTYTYCGFDYPQGNSSAYKDADWINDYNGVPCGYFISFDQTTNLWTINDSCTANGRSWHYVQDVCSTPPAY